MWVLEWIDYCQQGDLKWKQEGEEARYHDRNRCPTCAGSEVVVPSVVELCVLHVTMNAHYGDQFNKAMAEHFKKIAIRRHEAGL
jgi:hypothetical protein